MCWSSGMTSSPPHQASCPSQSLNLVCKIPISLLGLSETNTIGYYGWLGRGNIRANGHPGGTPWRQFQCGSCQGYFQETHGTPLHGKQVSSDLFVWAVGALAEGLGIRAVARVFAVDPNTVRHWLASAADHLQAFSRYFLHDVRVTQVQLDELIALLWVQPARRHAIGPAPKPRWMPL